MFQGKQILQVVFIRGAECKCAPVYSFQSKWVENEKCHIPCPVKDLNDRNKALKIPSESEICGGNRGYSIYCEERSDGNPCSNLPENPFSLSLNPGKTTVEKFSVTDLSPSGYPQNSIGMVLQQNCTRCSYTNNNLASRCLSTYIGPSFDYFPVNSAEACVEYCGTTIQFVGNIPDVERSRKPTPYALMTWSKQLDVQIPICRCLNPENRNIFTPADPVYCQMTCPGKPDEMCGGLDDRDNKEVYATVYCVNEDDEACEVTTTETLEPSTSTLETTHEEPTEPPTTLPDTTPNEPTEDTRDPCLTGEVDCDEEPTTTTTTITTETTPDVTQPTTTITTETTPNVTLPTTIITTETTPNETLPTTPTTPITTTETTTNATTSITTTRSTTTQTTTSCAIICQKTDWYGISWEACANSWARMSCSSLSPNATGTAYWRCLSNGNFETSHPDISACHAPWVRDFMNRAEDIGELVRNFRIH